MPENTLIVSFAQADPTQIERLGAKGAKLVEDFKNFQGDFPDSGGDISVPDGFILATDVWRFYHQAGDRLSEALFARIGVELAALERRENRIFGDTSGAMPLVVAVRGGAPVSLPGAISTILNVGLNDQVVAALIAAGEDEGFLLNTYLDAIRMYGEVVLGLPYQRFYQVLQRFQAGDEGSVPVAALRRLIDAYKAVLDHVEHPRYGRGFEARPLVQLRNAVAAVFDSWMSETAIEARHSRSPKVPDDMGTAVVIQTMVFGNRDAANSLGGVLFTRNPRTGSATPVIEWAPQIQCDKIVSGKLRKQLRRTDDLRSAFPDIHQRLLMVRERSEARARRPLDMEFTVESRKLYILQRRPLRMTFHATARAMWDLVDEGKTNIQLASLIINNALEQPERVLREDFSDFTVLARGEPITDTADCGVLAFGTEQALTLARRGQPVIMLRRRPYGETDVAVNHPMVRGIVRCDGNVTGHEAVSAVAYSKPYLISLRDLNGASPILVEGERIRLNPASALAGYVGRQVFVDGERGVLAWTAAESFLEDRKARKKLYVDWEYLKDQFVQSGYPELDYDTLLDLHYQWELDLGHFQRLEERLKNHQRNVSEQELLHAFATYLQYIPPRHRERTLELKDVRVEQFELGPPLVYLGSDLGREVRKILRALMLCTTWRTHWVHEAMVSQARRRGENENDVIRDIFLKNRTMGVVRGFEQEGFHLMKVPHHHNLIFASNFEYDQDLDKVEIGPDQLNYGEKEGLARNFLVYLEQVNPKLSERVRMIRGEPPLGQGHARIVSIGLAIRDQDFALVCRYLRTFLDQSRHGCPIDLASTIPAGEFIDLYQLDPGFAPFPELRIMVEKTGPGEPPDYLIAFGSCSFGEFDGVVYGHAGYDRLLQQVRAFSGYLRECGLELPVRPWSFEVDPFRRHSVIAAVGIRTPAGSACEVLDRLKAFFESSGGTTPTAAAGS